MGIILLVLGVAFMLLGKRLIYHGMDYCYVSTALNALEVALTVIVVFLAGIFLFAGICISIMELQWKLT